MRMCLNRGRFRPCTAIEQWYRRLSSLQGSAEADKSGRSINASFARWAMEVWDQDSSKNKTNLKYPGFMHRTDAVNSQEKHGFDVSNEGVANPVENCSASDPKDSCRSVRSNGVPDSASWTRLCEDGQLYEAFEVLDGMIRQGGFISRAMLYALLKGCIARRNLVVGRLVHDLSARIGYEVNTFLGSHIIRMYAACGSLVEAKQVFNALPAPTAFVWTSMISAYGEFGECKLALEVYEQMREAGVKPDVYVFVAVLKACASTADLMSGRQIHKDVVDSGLETNVFIGSTLIDMYAKCGRLEDARRAFESLPMKDEVVWSAVLAGYAQNGFGEETLALYERMQQEGMSADNDITLVSILKACGSTGALQEGRRIHAHIRERGYNADLYVGNTLVDMYAKCGSLAEARRVFDAMHIKDVVTWNAMIAAYAQHGLGEEALELYASMQQGGFMPDNVTFVSVLKACSSIEDVKWIHGQIVERRRGAEVDVFVGSTLVDMYAKWGSVDDARSTFDRLSLKNLVTWNAMIMGYVHHGLGQEALELFARMQQESTAPDKAVVTSTLKACGSIGALQQGRSIHAQIVERGWEADVIVGNTLVDMYAKCGSVVDAQMVFDSMPMTDVVTWNALINGYGQHNDHKMAIQCFKHMQQHGVNPDAATFTSLLVACSHAGLVKDGELYFQMMQEQHHIRPTTEHYNCMVDLYGRVGCLHEAENLLLSLPLQMHSVGWRSLLSACKTHGNVEIGRRCFNRLVQLEPQHSAAYVLMSDMYDDIGKWVEAEGIDKLRKQAGAKKKPAKAVIEVRSKVHEFVVGEQRDDTFAKLRSLNQKCEEEEQGLSKVQPDDKDKENALCGHAEKLALAFGLLNTPQHAALLVTKNLRMCNDCHTGTKIISRIEKREIVVRDEHRVHCFKDGLCCCGD